MSFEPKSTSDELVAYGTYLARHGKRQQRFEKAVERIDHRHAQRIARLLDKQKLKQLANIRRSFAKALAVAEDDDEALAALGKAQGAVTRLCQRAKLDRNALRAVAQDRINAVAKAYDAMVLPAQPLMGEEN